jgi:AcrR family transcriptional regulator
VGPLTDKPRGGLRELKKARTRAAIQQHALRLFGKQGYDATTVEQIAKAAEVAPGTVFRYFGTKEGVVLFDPMNEVLLATFEAQPPELGVFDAMRGAYRDALAALTPADLRREAVRQQLIRSVPVLRARMVDDVAGAIDYLANAVAERTGRSAQDLAVRTLAGAVVGAVTSIAPPSGSTWQADYVDTVDKALTLLEAGLPV